MAIEMSVPLDKLEGLGSPDSIAKFFEKEGITGYQRMGVSCPVSNYLTREGAVSEGQYVHTSRCDVTLYNINCEDEWFNFVPLNDKNTNVSDFVKNFDYGEYPNLIMKDD